MSLRRYFRRKAWDEERARELEAHLAHEMDENRERGMSVEEARRRAYVRLGNPRTIREEIWEMNSVTWVENLGRDVRYAMRQLRRSPGFAAIAIVTLALGIGVNTAIFSMVNGMLFSSLHVRAQDRVVQIAFRQKDAGWNGNVSGAELRTIQRQTKGVFSAVIGGQYGLDGLSMAGHRPDRAFTDYVTGNYFAALGVRPYLGRFFRASAGQVPGADPEVVLSYAYWKEHFGGARGIVGQQVELDGEPMTVIGVAPRSFRGLDTLLAVQVYMPLAMVVPIEKTPLKEYNDVANRGLSVYARLAPGMTAERANTALAVVARRLAADHPRKERDAGLRTFGLSASRVGGFNPNNNLKEVAALFLALAAMVLLLACVNVANLVLVRASIREREMVVRSALGAQRSRLIRQMLTESVLLGLLGGAAGVGLGLWASSVLSAANLGTDLPLRLYFGFDWHVFAFSAGIAVMAGLLVGIVPATRMARANLNRVLREGGRGVAGRSSRFRDALVAMQVAVALMLLVVAGLFTRTLRKTEHASLGFNPAHVLLLSMDPGEIGYDSAQAKEFYATLMERVRAVPGVRAATMAGATPMGMIDNSSDTVKVPGYEVPQGQAAPTAGYNIIGTGYFRTLEIPLAEGRSFTKADNKKGAYVAIVSEAMAKKFWPHEDAVGREFTMGSDAKHPLRVVGVAKDARYLGLQGPIRPYFYVPYRQHSAADTLNSLEIRTEGDPGAMIPEMERTIHGIAPNLPVFEVKTLHEALYSPNGLLLYEVIATAAGILGTLGLVLAMVGVYGVLSYVVRQKTGEIGVRMALGAQRGDILRIVYRHGVWIVGIGLALGLAAGLGAAHVMRSMISVSATDPVTFLGVPAILAAIAMAACYIPARRAMRVEPMQALRME